MINFTLSSRPLDRVFNTLIDMIGPNYRQFLLGNRGLDPEDQVDHKDFIFMLNKFKSKVIPVSGTMYGMLRKITDCQLVNVVDKRILTEPEFWLGI